LKHRPGGPNALGCSHFCILFGGFESLKFFVEMSCIPYHKLQNHFSKGKAELEADLEVEALPEVLSFCWKQKR
jgi:hypothetical protein